MSDVVVLDVNRLLDECAAGKAGAKALQSEYKKLKKQREKLPEDRRASFDARAFNTLEKERAQLRADVLAKARPVVQRLMSERGAKVVLRAEQALAFDGSVDITAEVIAAVDKG
jgi:Skp family chaperone for outer membrane proteins